MISYISNGKVMIIRLIVGLIKKISLHEMKCFPEPYTCSKSKIKAELGSSNHVRKSDFKNATVIDT